MNPGRRPWLLPAALLLACVACANAGAHRGVTLALHETSEHRCCIVSTVNPEASRATVFCFVSIFDDDGRLLSTSLIPPIPPDHRRSSGFEAPPGRGEHGFEPLPLDLPDQSYTSTCRPAAWHGGAPI